MNWTSAITEVNNISKVFNMPAFQVHALREISFNVHPGEFVGLLGPSGCGKTTLINIIAGLLTPTSGEVIIGGHKITDMPAPKVRDFRLRSIGMIFQDHLLVDSLTAAKNVELPLIFGRIPSSKRYEKAMELLSYFGLEDKADHLPGELSGGEKQRVGIARSLVFDPVLILADEPTGDLDTRTGHLIVRTFKELTKTANRSVVMVSHDPSHRLLFDRVLQMSDGQLV